MTFPSGKNNAGRPNIALATAAPIKDGDWLTASGLLCDFARVAFLAHDLVAVSAADDILDLDLLMAWNEDEQTWLGASRLVFDRGQLDPLGAVGVGALAEDAQAIVSISRKLGLQPLVDLAEHHFVQGKTLLLVAHPCVVSGLTLDGQRRSTNMAR